MVELDRVSEPFGRLLRQALEEVDRLPQRPRHVAQVVVGVRALKRGQRAGVGPALEEPSGVPGVDRRIDRARMPAKERQQLATSDIRRRIPSP